MTDPTCGSGVTAEITENGASTPIWGPQVISAGDGVGVDANLDGVSVNAGDVLHFAVQENGSSQCRVSWTPSVAIPNPVTTVKSPVGGIRLNGTTWFDASATDSSSPIKQVQFVVSGGNYHDAVANVAYPTIYGWLASWPTTDVPDGTYTLQSMVTDAAGNVAYSPGVTITVDNALTTSVWATSTHSWVSGSKVLLDAGASDPTGTLSNVEFHLTGGSLNDALVATATSSPWGWYASWDSTTVPDGTYTLESVAYNTAGTKAYSAGVTIIVENTPPATGVLIPSTGASVGGTQVLLDASAPANVGVTKVELHLSGGSLNNALVATATATYYGWLAFWDSTTVPDGTYTLQSEAYDGAGNVGFSAPVSVTVAN
jgi:major membrane immunogen (membrane-anchored lipoprotein)